MSEKLHCICCGSDMKNIDKDGHQPSGGLSFISHGHYGSSYFDPMDGSYIQIAVCDVCLQFYNEDRVSHSKRHREPDRGHLDEIAQRYVEGSTAISKKVL
jgi:hypothetical protein